MKKNVYLVASNKGGVDKTTLTIMFAIFLANYFNKKVWYMERKLKLSENNYFMLIVIDAKKDINLNIYLSDKVLAKENKSVS